MQALYTQSSVKPNLYDKMTGLVTFLDLVLPYTLQYCVVQENRQVDVHVGRLKVCHWKSSKTGPAVLYWRRQIPLMTVPWQGHKNVRREQSRDK